MSECFGYEAVTPRATALCASTTTAVQLDARLLLSLRRGSEVPPGFADPFEINLSTALQKACGREIFSGLRSDSEEELEDGKIADAAMETHHDNASAGEGADEN